jgi:hypothetical protein
MENLIDIAGQYGMPGLIIFSFGWYIVRKDREHKEERKDVTQALKAQHEEALEVTKNNTTVLSEIATIIKNKRN